MKTKNQIHTTQQMADETETSLEKIRHMIAAGIIEPPDTKIGIKMVFSEKLYKKNVRIIRRPLYSRSAMAKKLGIKSSHFRNAIYAGFVNEPAIDIHRRSFYCDSDIPKIKKAFKEYCVRPGPTPSADRAAEGYFSVSQVATACDVSTATILHHTKFDKIQPPTHKYKSHQGSYYNRKEKAAIVKKMDQRRRDFPYMDAAATHCKGKSRAAKGKVGK